MLTVKAIKGVVRGGKIELSERIDAEDGTEVIISVPVQVPARQNKMITFGMLRVEGGPDPTLEDFKICEWHGEEEFWGPLDNADD